MESSERATTAHEDAELQTAEHGTTERETTKSDDTGHETTEPEIAQDANTKGPEEGARDEYWVHDEIAGLYVTMNPANVHGRTTVIRHAGTEDFLVWNSSWDHTQPLADTKQEVTRNAAHVSLGVVTDAKFLDQTISVYHIPVEGTPSIMRSEPNSARVKFIQEYAKAHDPARLTEDDFKRPIPATGVGESVDPGVTSDAASGIAGVAAPSLNDRKQPMLHQQAYEPMLTI